MKKEFTLYNPHKAQRQVLKSKKRFRVIVCGRRWGKTTLAINHLIISALAKEGEYWYVAPTYRQAKTIAWRMLVNNWRSLPEGIQGDKNESELWIELGNSRISLKGADNEDSLRGSGLHGIIMDEVASYPNWDRLWGEAIRPALTDFKGFAWFIGTPKGFNHFYDLYNKEQDDKDYKSFHFTSFDNPYLDSEEIEKAKEELTEDAFGQEHLAEFKKFTGLIYKGFSRDIHIIEPINIPVDWPRYGAMDFGFTNPTVHLWIALDRDDNVYIYDEYYQSGETTEYHSNVIKGKTQQVPIITIWGDPSGEQNMIDYGNQNLYITPAIKVIPGDNKGWVKAGIDRVERLLKVTKIGKPKLFVFKNCRNTIREFESYRWIEKKELAIQDANWKEMPLKANDHCMDALRYFVVSHFASKPIGDTILSDNVV